MALLFSDFKKYVRVFTREDNSSGVYRYASDDNLLLIWNLILPKINMLTHSNVVDNVDSPILTVANQRLYALPASNAGGTKAMQDLYDVYYNGKPLNYMTLTEARMISGLGNPWWTITGDPIRFYFSNYQIGVYPVPTYGGYPLQVFGTSGINNPTNSQDTTATSQLDDRISDAIINVGCFYILKSRREFEWASKFEEDFKNSIREYGQVETDRLLRGSTSMMDLDPHERF